MIRETPASTASLPPPAAAGGSACSLKVPSEPAELRLMLRAQVLGGQPFVASSGSGVGGLLWRRWRASLQASGMDRAGFGAVVDGYRRELWLWVIGDRPWEPTINALAGRVARRLPETPA